VIAVGVEPDDACRDSACLSGFYRTFPPRALTTGCLCNFLTQWQSIKQPHEHGSSCSSVLRSLPAHRLNAQPASGELHAIAFPIPPPTPKRRRSMAEPLARIDELDAGLGGNRRMLCSKGHRWIRTTTVDRCPRCHAARERERNRDDPYRKILHSNRWQKTRSWCGRGTRIAACSKVSASRVVARSRCITSSVPGRAAPRSIPPTAPASVGYIMKTSSISGSSSPTSTRSSLDPAQTANEPGFRSVVATRSAWF
jgi:hypothetical protein